jgi:cob(I)alamin adenosyltransferase
LVSLEDTGTGTDGGVNPVAVRYLNRLSDLLFVLARYANLDAGGDVLWQPGGGRQQPGGDAAEGEPPAT